MRTVVMALLLASTVPALAGPDRSSAEAVESLKAYALYKAGDYEQARQLWQALAERGNTTAINNLANLYDQGQGVDQDPVEAVRLLRRAAELGDPVAQLNLGLAYERGRGVARDNRIAAQWFRLAAEQEGEQAA